MLKWHCLISELQIFGKLNKSVVYPKLSSKQHYCKTLFCSQVMFLHNLFLTSYFEIHYQDKAPPTMLAQEKVLLKHLLQNNPILRAKYDKIITTIINLVNFLS